MTVNVVPLDGDGHHAVQALLPWYVKNQLTLADVVTIEAHLATCAPCRAELALERRMSDVLGDLGAQAHREEGHVEQGLTSLHARIVREGAVATAPAPDLNPGRARPLTWTWPSSWTRWVLGAQFATIVWLAALLVLPAAPAPTYRALGAPSHAAAGNVVVRFRPDATEREMRLALQAAGARLVDGPTATDAYLLSVPIDRPGQALAELRARTSVLLAESLDAGPRP